MLRVLVVEDDDPIREVVEFALRDAGYDTIGALDGQHALRLAMVSQPDVVVMDLGLPIMSGPECVMSWREHLGSNGPPIVVMSGQPRPLTSKESSQIGRGARSRAPLITRLPLRADRLFGLLGSEPELPQERSHVVVAALFDDLAAIVQPAKHGTLELDALLCRRNLFARRRLERAGMRAGHAHLRRAIALVLLDDGHDLEAQIRERPEERRGVLANRVTTAQWFGIHRVVRDGLGCVRVRCGVDGV